MPEPLKFSFPCMGDYNMPIGGLVNLLFPGAEILPPPPMTRKTAELGSRNSPDYVCSPFKYNMGNYIEALERGANVLLQTGMGCRYGYYGEVQEQILRDMGYSFEFICLSRSKAQPNRVFQTCKRLNPKLTLPTFFHALLITVLRIQMMDRLDYMLRERIGFEAEPGSFERAKAGLLEELSQKRTVGALCRTFFKYRRRYCGLPLQRPERPLRVGIVGELYTVMEPFSNFYLEKQLAKEGISVSRKMNVTFLLFGKHDRIELRRSKGYLNYAVGANGLDSVCQCLEYAKKGYDGILHIKSFGCTPELNAQPAIMNISRNFGVPIVHLSFDTQTSETGLQTRIEAFADMIKMKKDSAYEKPRQPRRGHRVHFYKRRFD